MRFQMYFLLIGLGGLLTGCASQQSETPKTTEFDGPSPILLIGRETAAIRNLEFDPTGQKLCGIDRTGLITSWGNLTDSSVELSRLKFPSNSFVSRDCNIAVTGIGNTVRITDFKSRKKTKRLSLGVRSASFPQGRYRSQKTKGKQLSCILQAVLRS